MLSKTNKRGSIAPTHTGPIRIGTPLHRALESVAQAVAALLYRQQPGPAIPSEDLHKDTDHQQAPADNQLPGDQ